MEQTHRVALPQHNYLEGFESQQIGAEPQQVFFPQGNSPYSSTCSTSRTCLFCLLKYLAIKGTTNGLEGSLHSHQEEKISRWQSNEGYEHSGERGHDLTNLNRLHWRPGITRTLHFRWRPGCCGFWKTFHPWRNPWKRMRPSLALWTRGWYTSWPVVSYMSPTTPMRPARDSSILSPWTGQIGPSTSSACRRKSCPRFLTRREISVRPRLICSDTRFRLGAVWVFIFRWFLNKIS